ncbi:hypothetical protein MML48_9g00012114 [Holotrichia oblita]|uniref:Uncharacterized protein n=1 Tax=Holotrichia oblita TaxID=644536 RepID=A0ACB9SJT4_HOLOL|nr:hypothetical protein MML48_9g00012114 [Holotrichia oblita]
MDLFESSSSSSAEDIPMYLELIPDNRIFRDRTNPFDMYDNEEFCARYRLSKESVTNLMHACYNNIAPVTHRSKSISAMNQILCTLRFLATGTFQAVIGDTVGIHKSTVSRILKVVLREFARIAREKVCMPDEPVAIQNTKTAFMAMHGFPNVIGCVDGTHIKIQSPGGENSEIYRNRKGYFSYNVQMVCDPNLKICSIDARWPGSTHDSTIFNASMLRMQMEQEYENCILLGDSAYPCRNYLMTPVAHPRNVAENNYNNAQIHTRNCIERCFGVLKRRFPALALGMRIAKETALTAIVAASVLHNIAIEENNILPAPEVEIPEVLHEDAPLGDAADGNAARREIINTFFN